MLITQALEQPSPANCGLPPERMIEISFDDQAMEKIAIDRRVLIPILIAAPATLIVSPLFFVLFGSRAWILCALVAFIAFVIAGCFAKRLWNYIMCVTGLREVDDLCRDVQR